MKKLVFLTYAAICLWPLQTQAQTKLSEVTPLSFGRFSVTSYNVSRDLTVDAATNSVSAAPEFVIETPPQRGEYRLEGFAPGTEITITIGEGELAAGAANAFTTVDYTVSPSPVVAGDGGDVVFYIGATLRTRGDGVFYDTGRYQDDLDIQFDWIP